jgi:hypothetical protein
LSRDSTVCSFLPSSSAQNGSCPPNTPKPPQAWDRGALRRMRLDDVKAEVRDARAAWDAKAAWDAARRTLQQGDTTPVTHRHDRTVRNQGCGGQRRKRPLHNRFSRNRTLETSLPAKATRGPPAPNPGPHLVREPPDLPVNRRDQSVATTTAPDRHLCWSGAVSAAWRVMDSNQRRTTPTVLQNCGCTSLTSTDARRGAILT